MTKFLTFSIFLGLPILLTTYAATVYAHNNDIGDNALVDSYYNDHARGWHWYEYPEEAKKEIAQLKPQDPVKEMNAIKVIVQKALDQAILDPSTENVKNYLVLQNQISNQSSLFSQMWRKVLLENPSLDYSLLHPTNAIGSRVDIDQKHSKEDATIYKLAQETGLFFFYHSSCLYCQKFAPIVKNFAAKYGISVIPITTNGISLPEFPDSKQDNGQARKFNVTAEPALFAVNPYTGKVYPISFGLVSEEELRRNVLNIATNFRGDL